MSTVAIIPARGGSRGIPRKNLVPVCGKPLLAWSIEHALGATAIDSVYVSSDCAEILAVAEAFGARPILRPAELSDDSATSESAWCHALDVIENTNGKVDVVVGIQATSPVRDANDLDAAIEQFHRESLDSLIAACEVHDFFLWQIVDGTAQGVNHDYRARRRRQDIQPSFLENGSFYIFKPELLRATACRLGGRIGVFRMAKHKMFQIDEPEDIALCEAVLRGYGNGVG
jgi:CMP-N,N'-diacetyllegionaminic acid synthase